MKRIPIYILILVILIIVVLIAVIWPKISITSGVEQYEGEEKIFARYALKQTDLLLSGSIEPFVVLSRHVDEIKVISTNESCGYEPFLVHNRYEANVELYTLFGRRYGLVKVSCDKVQIRRN
jgi:hypothetical protein